MGNTYNLRTISGLIEYLSDERERMREELNRLKRSHHPDADFYEDEKYKLLTNSIEIYSKLLENIEKGVIIVEYKR